MKCIATVLPICLVVSCFLLENIDARRWRNGKSKLIWLRERKAEVREKTDGTIDFPKNLEYTIDLQSEGSRDLNLVLNPYMQMPGKNAERKRKYAFYTDANTGESFACKVKLMNGKVKCDLAGIIERYKETCFISPNSKTADCENSDGFSDGTLLAVDDNLKPIDSASIRLSNNTVRKERRSGLPEPGFKVVEIAFVVDEAFMIPFYNRNPDNDAAAEEEAELYITLLANEMSVNYRSVKEVSSGQLDLVIYPASFIHPGKGNNFAWSENNRRNTDELNVNNGLRDFLNYAYSSLNVNFDHAMAISGLDLYVAGQTGTGLLGVAYTNTMCRPNAPAVSIQENVGFNLGWIASHELGHSLGYIHDQSDQCPAGRNIMSSYIFNPSSSTKDTYNIFSLCSVEAFIRHLNSYPDCTANRGFTDAQFQANFCSGLLGAQDMSLDRQCQIRTGSSTASACSTRVSTRSCYEGYTAYCRTSPSSICSERLGFVWNGTPCGTRAGSMCYQGDCVPEFNVCPAVTSSNTQPTATSALNTKLPTVATYTSISTTTQTSCSCCLTLFLNTCCRIGNASGTSCRCCKPTNNTPCSCCGIRGFSQRRCCRIFGSNCRCCS